MEHDSGLDRITPGGGPVGEPNPPQGTQSQPVVRDMVDEQAPPRTAPLDAEARTAPGGSPAVDGVAPAWNGLGRVPAPGDDGGESQPGPSDESENEQDGMGSLLRAM